MSGAQLEEAFKISCLGAVLVREKENAEKLLRNIKGLDDIFITSACQLAGYAVCFRAGKVYYKPVKDMLCDFKVSKDEPRNKSTLQILLYYGYPF